MQSKPKMSFFEYIKTKQKLKSAGEDSPKYFSLYEVNKYCKIPLLECVNSDEKIYISLKPKDQVKILWEITDLVHTIPRYVTIIDEDENETKYFFSWNLQKINKWLASSTQKK